MLRKLKGLIGIILIVAAIGGIWFWETYGREAWTYEEVLVLREPAERNTYIDVDKLAVLKVEREKMVAGAITNPAQILGKETIQYIPAGMMLVEEFFDEPELVVDEGQYMFSIPNDWLEAYPQTLRRRDTVYVYPVTEETEYERMMRQLAGQEGPTTTPEGKPLFSAVVAYAKNGSNQEVESVDPNRLTGTSNVSLVEIVATMENVKAMEQAVKEGYKFILLYR